MEMENLNVSILIRNDTSTNWEANKTTVLSKGEIGIEFMPDGKVRMKVGDGISEWQELNYFGSLITTGSGSPAASLAGELGATYYDTTNNKFYIKTSVASGNPWKQLVMPEDLSDLGAGDMLKSEFATNGASGVVDAAKEIVDSTSGVTNHISVDDNKTGADNNANNSLWTANKTKNEISAATNPLKSKLDTIEEGAEVNVQPDWDIADTSSDAYIKNKPTSLPADGGNADTVGNKTVDDTKEGNEFLWTAEKSKAYAEAQAAATKVYVDEKVADAIDGVTQFDIQVVETLPSHGVKGIIYLIAHNHGTGDIYDEYVWITSASKYEKIGNTDIDLSGYITVESLPTITVGNATKVNNHTVQSDVPAGAKFTDTVYTLPTATSSALGGVKSGETVVVNVDGTLDVGDSVLLVTDKLVLNGGNASS